MNKRDRELVEEGLEYLEAQPKNKWTTGQLELGDRYCALGHLYKGFGARKGRKINNIINLLAQKLDVVGAGGNMVLWHVNDSAAEHHKNPKERVINFIKKILAK